jgi:pilus assembly protein CpaC
MTARATVGAIGAMIAFLAAVPAPAQAQEPPPLKLTGRSDAPEHVTLPIGKSRLVELAADVQEVVVGDSAVADVSVSSPRRLFVVGRKVGETNATVLDADGRTLAHLEISVGVDASVVRTALGRMMPGHSIDVAAEGSSLILTGTAASDGDVGRALSIARVYVDKPEKVVNLITITRSQQVLIRVRVAEVQRRALKEIGAFGTLNRSTEVTPGDARVGGRINSIGLNPLSQFAGTFVLEGIRDVNIGLQLLEQRGLVRNLAEPNLVAVSGETASMLAGGEVPIPVPDRDGIKIEYKPFGVSLAFVPVILNSGAISLKLSTEVSSLSSESVTVPLITGPATIPAFVVRRAASTVELPSGGSVMLAGLIQNDVLSGMNGVPGLMDLPVLGQLFRSESFKRDETELVVIVTTSLVKPAGPETMIGATDAISPSTDTDMWLYGKLLKRFTPGFVQDETRPPPSVGFTLDEVSP